MAKKLISFLKTNGQAALTGNGPAAASSSIPEWYKQLAMHLLPKGTRGHHTKITIKACPPFLDSMTTGYILRTEVDLLVEQIDGMPYIQWQEGWAQIEKHDDRQITKEQIPSGYSPHPLKFLNPYVLQTPPGYSSLFVHPLNRTDLPFLTLSGVVETDTYYNNIHFPFFLKEGFEGIIPSGTPIVQVIPIKREAWKSEIADADAKKLATDQIKLRGKYIRSYKSQWWVRKSYE
jgi:hypothetical protein